MNNDSHKTKLCLCYKVMKYNNNNNIFIDKQQDSSLYIFFMMFLTHKHKHEHAAATKLSDDLYQTFLLLTRPLSAVLNNRWMDHCDVCFSHSRSPQDEM